MMAISLQKVLLVIVFLLWTSGIIQAQNVIQIGQPSSFGRATDLTKDLEARCIRHFGEQIRPNLNLEIRYDRHSLELVEKIGSQIKGAISQTFALLDPQSPTAIRIYVAKVDRLPASYQVSSPPNIDFVYPIVYDSKTSLDSDCQNITKLCETIYTTIPHEMTHHANNGKFSDNATWLGEGLAEYVSGLVGERLSPKQAFKREMETLPEVSLNSDGIRETLLSWSYKPETLTEESILYYGAAHQMLRSVIAEAQKQGEKDALRKILAFSRDQARPLDSDTAISFLKKDLNVDVTKLGVLEEKRKKEIFESAKATYRRERNNKKTGYKYNSLVTFAYLTEPLSDEILVNLIAEVFDDNNTSQFKKLSANAVLARLDQPTFLSATLRLAKMKKFNSLEIFRKYLLKVSLDR